MPEHLDKTHAFDPAVQSDGLAFKAQEMIACGSCGRSNPPNRFNCIYCAHDLDVAAENTAALTLTARKLESWERGFNVIFLNRLNAEASMQTNAALLGRDAADLAEIFESDTPLPIARVETERIANVICSGLEQSGINCSVVSDDNLMIEKPQVRLSSIEFAFDRLSLVNFNTGEKTEIEYNDLVLIVSGSLRSERVDSLEKKRRHGKSKLIDETATVSDELMFDLYTRDDATGFRISQTGFDFSCLGEDKGLLAVENIRLLLAELKERAPNARYISSYSKVRRLLDDVWEIESRKDFHGLQRSGFGKVEFASVASSSNLTQFNRFSRLQSLMQR